MNWVSRWIEQSIYTHSHGPHISHIKRKATIPLKPHRIVNSKSMKLYFLGYDQIGCEKFIEIDSSEIYNLTIYQTNEETVYPIENKTYNTYTRTPFFLPNVRIIVCLLRNLEQKNNKLIDIETELTLHIRNQITVFQMQNF